MRIESVEISGFRSFGPAPVKVTFAGALTGIVGPNGSGKTALLQALSKLFGVTRAQRTVVRSDFHVPPGVDPNDRSSREMFIDVIISLPELATGSATPATVAPTFNVMRITAPGGVPVCRMRLEARWDDDGTVDGEVSQTLHWISTLEAKIPDDQRHAVSPSVRGLIQLYYTPATRDAGSQIRSSTGALAARLLNAIDWSDDARTIIETASQEMQGSFVGEAAVKAISKALTSRWSNLNADSTDTEPTLALNSRRFEEIVRSVSVVFQQGPAGIERGLDALSDGQQSLFYFALAAAVFDLERDAAQGKISGFDNKGIATPALTIFAIEEPENHLSPFYLSRIVAQVRSLVAGDSAQAILTSHAPGVLSRIDPKEVRYCRFDTKTRLTSVKAIDLPEGDVAASKFVRGAMLAYPELYFARFVVLGEGDSEQVVLPRLARAMGLLIDTAFVAIVPLGGRHVHYFWRLLKGLGIPHATLLDLDIGRKGGGFGRIKTVIQQLIANGQDPVPLLDTSSGPLPPDEFADMHNWDNEGVSGWANFLRNYGVFFAEPLDLDLAMLASFPAAYAATIPADGGPDLTVEEAAISALSKDGLKAYDGELEAYKAFLPAYRYHFLSHSKPATHLRALAELEYKDLKAGMPESIRALLQHVVANLRHD
ncbi:ATP-dependent nuclease [Paraburkholderia strydomiana]|uniref:ATP-dependent nuclease n=1 Tax=Paraburkholderia strydomiana TaxID=1245417 RepID=UPI0038BA7294